MKEISIRALLDEQRLANLNRYQKLEELANLQRPNRYDQLTFWSAPMRVGCLALERYFTGRLLRFVKVSSRMQ